MKKLFFIPLLVLLILNGCKSNVENEDIFQYKDTYVGSGGTVGNIILRLPNPSGENTNGLELKTTEKPYGIIINYINSDTTDEINKNYEEIALYNASFLFALVKNVDWVTFNFVEQEYTVTRQELQNWYGKDLREFSDENELSQFIQKYLEDENKAKQFLN
ncbi:DUF4825 domain-containing protein [Bacillus solimangrovi]|uniref:DUF4825 domain-containing protein n=1 Tax=Bacillus solimangrovi TaxID=1305675 RepID=A0A1E5LFJ6_9BACI|nr:DUF4825 domain-containing protein [Bacillus solimangrovi]OEH92842.1 hypothetical protein BFG57_02275 [Bacillus solimangrovi]